MKNYASYYFPIHNIPEKNLIERIRALSRDIEEAEDPAVRCLSEIHREYYIKELVQRDETA